MPIGTAFEKSLGDLRAERLAGFGGVWHFKAHMRDNHVTKGDRTYPCYWIFLISVPQEAYKRGTNRLVIPPSNAKLQALYSQWWLAAFSLNAKQYGEGRGAL